ncbi:hypothetical protein S40293_06744 [Stachybotrys chartarum IBT 40293]|nr:hypothetical protein S40293_06744 [Stachybotrys chartarum IBT 40293]
MDGGSAADDTSEVRPGLLRSWTSSALAAQRRSLSNDRINDILENARQRAERSGPDPLVQQQSQNPPGSPRSISRTLSMPPLHESPPANGFGSGVDETTGIASYGTTPNYQAVHAPTDNRTARPRKTVKSRSPSVTRFHLGPPTNGSTRTLGLHPTEEEEEPPVVDSEPPQKTKQTWWTRNTARFRSVELDNVGSVARDHLALERTFLAWLRTSLAFASIGVAVTQLFRLNISLPETDRDVNMDTIHQMGRPLGTTFLGVGALTLLLGYKRYVESQAWVMKGKFPASRGTIALTAFLAFAVIVLSLIVVVVIYPKEP